MDFEKLPDILDDFKVTDTFMHPGSLAILMKIMDEKKRQNFSLENFFCGGSLVYATIRKNFEKYFPKATLRIFYGTTEVHIITSLAHDPNAEPTNTVGLLKKNVQVKIMNDEDGSNLGVGEIGEICVKAWEHVFGVNFIFF